MRGKNSNESEGIERDWKCVKGGGGGGKFIDRKIVTDVKSDICTSVDSQRSRKEREERDDEVYKNV
jgi:hypothetical protein